MDFIILFYLFQCFVLVLLRILIWYTELFCQTLLGSSLFVFTCICSIVEYISSTTKLLQILIGELLDGAPFNCTSVLCKLEGFVYLKHSVAAQHQVTKLILPVERNELVCYDKRQKKTSALFFARLEATAVLWRRIGNDALLITLLTPSPSFYTLSAF